MFPNAISSPPTPSSLTNPFLSLPIKVKPGLTAASLDKGEVFLLKNVAILLSPYSARFHVPRACSKK